MDLNHYLNNKIFTQPARPYLGLSQAGDECDRRLWLYQQERTITKREARIFETGKILEEMILKELKEVFVIRNRQKEIVIDEKIKGHVDAVGYLRNDPKKNNYLLEIKTMNNRRFTDLTKGLVPKEYVAQMNVYMYALKLKSGFLVALNKDTSELFLTQLTLDEMVAQVHINRLKQIVATTQEPDRLSIRGLPHTICQWCTFKDHCWGN